MWVEIGRFELSNQWQFSEPQLGNLFRIRHLDNQVWGWGLICQSSGQFPPIELFGARRFYAQPDYGVFELIQPSSFIERAIAIRRSNRRYREPWTIALDVWQQQPAPKISIPQTITPTQLLQPSSQRRGAIIFNRSGARLALEFGGVPSLEDSTTILEPGGRYEQSGIFIQVPLTGVWEFAGDGAAEIREL